jgi:hypothetical protein
MSVIRLSPSASAVPMNGGYIGQSMGGIQAKAQGMAGWSPLMERRV